MFTFLQNIPEKSVILLHACAHNPTGKKILKVLSLIKLYLMKIFESYKNLLNQAFRIFMNILSQVLTPSPSNGRNCRTSSSKRISTPSLTWHTKDLRQVLYLDSSEAKYSSYVLLKKLHIWAYHFSCIWLHTNQQFLGFDNKIIKLCYSQKKPNFYRN